MNIIEALKDKRNNLRLSAGGGRWLYWDMIYEEWVVREHKYRARNTQVLLETPDEELAVAKLCEE